MNTVAFEEETPVAKAVVPGYQDEKRRAIDRGHFEELANPFLRGCDRGGSVSEEPVTCDRCGGAIKVPESLAPGYGRSLCLACAHPAYGNDTRAS